MRGAKRLIVSRQIRFGVIGASGRFVGDTSDFSVADSVLIVIESLEYIVVVDDDEEELDDATGDGGKSLMISSISSSLIGGPRHTPQPQCQRGTTRDPASQPKSWNALVVSCETASDTSASRAAIAA